MHYGKGKTVLDSCCGIGWGAFLLDAVASRTIAVDIDAPSLRLAKKLWPCCNTEYVKASALDLPFASETFGLVAAMESVEHFPEHQIDRYLGEISRVLKPGGILIGSSSFPETSKEAESIRARNPFHLHILTRLEMIGRLNNLGFEQIRIFTNRFFFFARKNRACH
jgi:ubiquinone/menaquinone biosynthesis C-methylase UbiE